MLLTFYLNNRVFLSRNYRLIVAPRKFDVLKTNICPRSEASRANMLVLRTSTFQGATIRSIVPGHKHSIVLLFTTKLETTRIYFLNFPTAMELLGVSYFPWYPLQMVLHLFIMYKQFYMSTVTSNCYFWRENLESWNFCARLMFYCTLVYPRA